MRARMIIARALGAGVLLAVAGAAPAVASAGHAMPVVLGDVLGLGHLAGSVFGGIGHALLGAFSWTFGIASKFILVTVGALVRMLIPRSWAAHGLAIMQWLVAVPNYAGQITSPSGAHVYGFAGINALRDLFTWIGAALLPLTFVYAISRAAAGHGDHVAIPIVRVLGLAAVLISYPYWWTEGAAVVNQLTDMILTLGPVVTGIHKLMLYAVGGVALGGWQLIDLALMAAIAIQLLALVFLKVAIILLGALLYATGPITLGLIPTDSGHALTRAWLSSVVALLALPVAWATVLAVGALLINDAGTAGPLIAGSGDIASLLGGVILAVAGLASLWLCLRAAKEAAGLLRLQLGGLLSLTASRRAGQGAGSASAGAGAQASGAGSLRRFGTQASGARQGAVGALAVSGPTGARIARAGAIAGGVGRRGAVGSAAVAARAGASSAGPTAQRVLARSRAGVVAADIARGAVAGWQGLTGAPSPRRAAHGHSSRSSERQSQDHASPDGVPTQRHAGPTAGSPSKPSAGTTAPQSWPATRGGNDLSPHPSAGSPSAPGQGSSGPAPTPRSGEPQRATTRAGARASTPNPGRVTPADPAPVKVPRRSDPPAPTAPSKGTR